MRPDRTTNPRPHAPAHAIRPDSDRAPEPVAEIGELARMKAMGVPPMGPARDDVLEIAGERGR